MTSFDLLLNGITAMERMVLEGRVEAVQKVIQFIDDVH